VGRRFPLFFPPPAAWDRTGLSSRLSRWGPLFPFRARGRSIPLFPTRIRVGPLFLSWISQQTAVFSALFFFFSFSESGSSGSPAPSTTDDVLRREPPPPAKKSNVFAPASIGPTKTSMPRHFPPLICRGDLGRVERSFLPRYCRTFGLRDETLPFPSFRGSIPLYTCASNTIVQQAHSWSKDFRAASGRMAPGAAHLFPLSSSPFPAAGGRTTPFLPFARKGKKLFLLAERL